MPAPEGKTFFIMAELFLTLPSYFVEVAKRLRKCDWLIHNFPDCGTDDIYNPALYIYGQELERTRYIACIDLNIMQYAVNLVKKRNASEHHRDACAMLLFCRFANIEVESGLAVYERINHGGGDIEEALDELAILRTLDNVDPDLLAAYMLGNTNSLSGLEVSGISDRDALKDGLTRYQRLIDWDSLYVLVLGLVSVHLDESLTGSCKLEHFMDWMIREFRLSLPIVVYAVRFFGKIRLRGMMKYKLSQSAAERKRAVDNMTWDLFLVDRYLKNWTNPDKAREEILFSQDRVVKELLRTAINVQYAEAIDPFCLYLNESQYLRCKELLDSASSRGDRIYLGRDWSPEYRSTLISRLEKDLGVASGDT